jgi:hypothetical protein
MNAALTYGFWFFFLTSTGWTQTSASSGPTTVPQTANVIHTKDYTEIRIRANQLTAQELPELRNKAQAGDLQTAVLLGMAYQIGCPGAARDPQESLRWYHLAADKRSSIAETQVAVSFDPEEGFAGLRGNNPEEALKWYRKAAEGGDDAVALFNMGAILYQTKRYSEAVDWYHKALESGEYGAALPLADLYSDGKALAGKNKDENRKEGLKYFQRLANEGNAGAQFVIAEAYQEGTFGLHRDPKQAFPWFLKSAEKQMPEAEDVVAIYYLSGFKDAVAKDIAEGVKWLQKAADADNADAQLRLALRFESGNGIATDFSAAYMWYELAKEGGAPEAQTPKRAIDAGSWIRLRHRFTDAEFQEGKKRLHAWKLAHGLETF